MTGAHVVEGVAATGLKKKILEKPLASKEVSGGRQNKKHSIIWTLKLLFGLRKG